jgi:tRNA (guanine-N7-)-methyltransferase
VEPQRPSEPRRDYAHAARLPEENKVDVRRLLELPAARLELEIGPGRGGFLIDRLVATDDVGIVGFEVKRKWTAIVNERLARRGLGSRGRVFAEDAALALPRLVPDGVLAAVFFNFPDPWWKKRHQKRLVLRPTLLDEVARLLATQGDLFVQTDVEERALLYEMQIGAHGAFAPRGDAPSSARLAENPYGARSHRERRAMDDGIPVYRMRFARR